MKYLFFILIGILVISSCKKEDPIDYTVKDQEIILQYLSDHNLTAQSTASGLHYIIEQKGNGPFPTMSSSVGVHYKGTLTGGKVFDESNGVNPVNFLLSNVIMGWQEGLQLFQEGSSGKLLIPSSLGYGDQETGSIPANSVLIFDVDLVDVF